MIVIEYKIKAKQYQLTAIDEAIRTGQFVRNKALRYWMDNKGVNKYDLNKYCRVLAKEFSFANKLNSTARQSNNYHKARVAKAKQHLRVSRQRKDHAVKLARCVCVSNDCIAYEDLSVRNLVRNRKLSKSISDVGWTQFRNWIEYFGWKFDKITVAVPPQYTSQDCPACGTRVKKSLSTRTHICKCGYVEDRDIAASINILKKGLSTSGHEGTYAWGETPSWAVGATLPSNGDSMNQESPTIARR